MALFKLRKKKVDEPVAAASPAESIEVMRRRARHRLIGAVVLVLAGVIGFPCCSTRSRARSRSTSPSRSPTATRSSRSRRRNCRRPPAR
ncbi:hypothetical protein [Ramlibacter montanisoli]|uniref:hypothetical protein n=1 Tax=Ramlibacter montanisoli TaxID=2732512 RepID=UPI002815CBCC|nr:hypothetical protein [Ramlibacter montanisoli]